MVLQNKKTSDVNVDKIFVETKRSSQYLNDDQIFRCLEVVGPLILILPKAS